MLEPVSLVAQFFTIIYLLGQLLGYDLNKLLKLVESNLDILIGLILLAICITMLERLTPTRSMQVTNKKSKDTSSAHRLPCNKTTAQLFNPSS